MISLSENSSELWVSSELKDSFFPLDVPLRRFPLGEDDPIHIVKNGCCREQTHGVSNQQNGVRTQ